MTTSLSQRQSLIRAAIARLEAGVDVPTQLRGWTGDELIQRLRHALADHDGEHARDLCQPRPETTARLVLGEPEDGDA